MGTQLSWGQLGPCTDVPEFSVFPLWLSSVWSPSPRGALCVSVLPYQHGGAQSPLLTPLPFPPGCPLFVFILFTWSSHGAVPGQGGPCCDQQVKSCCCPHSWEGTLWPAGSQPLECQE